MDVAAWLGGLGLEQYAQLFRDNDIDREVLCGMTAEDLKELGVSSFGHRRRLVSAIAALGGQPLRDVAQSATSATSAPASPPPSDAERRQLTVMFCDIVGSTALSTQFDPEDLRDVISAYHRAVADTVARFDGFVAKYMGDGVLIYFGYPQAHEDDAERSIRAGLAVIEGVAKLCRPGDLTGADRHRHWPRGGRRPDRRRCGPGTRRRRGNPQSGGPCSGSCRTQHNRHRRRHPPPGRRAVRLGRPRSEDARRLRRTAARLARDRRERRAQPLRSVALRRRCRWLAARRNSSS